MFLTPYSIQAACVNQYSEHNPECELVQTLYWSFCTRPEGEGGLCHSARNPRKGPKPCHPPQRAAVRPSPTVGPEGFHPMLRPQKMKSLADSFFFKAGNAIYMEFTIFFRVLLTSFHKRNPVFPEH